ncbi:MAG: AMP-binding protein [Opitutaceae bacterium]|nr:AMP-binding protein [Opitutaceae bacterium]
MERAELADCLGVRFAGLSRSRTIVREADPRQFQRKFAEGVAAGGLVFLADPRWTVPETARFEQLCDVAVQTARAAENPTRLGWLHIPTGGTGGSLKLARHDEGTLVAAVRGFQRHFGEKVVDAFGVLPLHHVSGLMAWLRCALTGGVYTAGDWSSLQAGELPKERGTRGCLSLVPTQLQRLLESESAVHWLKTFRAVFLGGGPSWNALLDKAAAAGIPVALSYGMTETAAMVAAQLPGEFLSGDRSCGRALPHVRIEINAESVVVLLGDSVFRGYAGLPASIHGRFETGDFGSIDDEGRLRIVGRRDQVIITGGEKVDPFAVEAVLRTSGQFSDVVVLGQSDSTWGQVVVVCYEDTGTAPDWTRVQADIERALAPYGRPKRYLPIKPWPRNEQGKVNRAILRQALGPG